MDYKNLYIVDNSEEEMSVKKYLHEWCSVSKQMDIATGYLEIGGLLTLDTDWQKLDKIRIILGNEVTKRTKFVIDSAVEDIVNRFGTSIDDEKEKNLPPKNFQPKPKNNPQSPTPKKSEKIDEGASTVLNQVEQKEKISSEEGQISPTNSKEKETSKEIKEKRNWKSWSPQEKILFYEIIANGGNYSSLQKLFKTMNDVRKYYYLIIINKNRK